VGTAARTAAQVAAANVSAATDCFINLFIVMAIPASKGAVLVLPHRDAIASPLLLLREVRWYAEGGIVGADRTHVPAFGDERRALPLRAKRERVVHRELPKR
jgi:hypothetical protein